MKGRQGDQKVEKSKKSKSGARRKIGRQIRKETGFSERRLDDQKADWLIRKQTDRSQSRLADQKADLLIRQQTDISESRLTVQKGD
jgi:hypothetical protein